MKLIFGYTFDIVTRKHKDGDKNKRSPEEDWRVAAGN